MPAIRTASPPPLMDDHAIEHVLGAFYRTPRAGGLDHLAGGGGPFGFDITTACRLHALIAQFACDGIVESGCHLGDTTDYLARAYPHLPVRACELDGQRAAFTRARLAGRGNAVVHHGDSACLMPTLLAGLERPLVFLDAHWGSEWPLRAELTALQDTAAVVLVDDFRIGHPRFGYDTYGGVVCGPDLVADVLGGVRRMFIGDVEADYPLPCLQPGRRSGTGIIVLGLDDTPLAAHPWFAAVPLRPCPVLPAWSSVPEVSGR
ncbi:hypothetical protein [Streptomyces violascens]|uniref:hypothetical protein n=1 Tax=Streptomyces violascens TaxID=67381 RepID=UPI0019A47432|nr:hypothetical protein [Streptomyces violascens]GGU37771.1 hypothetical protein GCM10010289_68370 [Streptomyces violascens]